MLKEGDNIKVTDLGRVLQLSKVNIKKQLLDEIAGLPDNSDLLLQMLYFMKFQGSTMGKLAKLFGMLGFGAILMLLTFLFNFR
jgi:hypothetical protein